MKQRLLDAVALDDLAMVDLGAERLAVVVDGRLEVVDGDGDVVDLGEQRSDVAATSDTGRLVVRVFV